MGPERERLDVRRLRALACATFEQVGAQPGHAGARLSHASARAVTLRIAVAALAGVDLRRSIAEIVGPALSNTLGALPEEDIPLVVVGEGLVSSAHLGAALADAWREVQGSTIPTDSASVLGAAYEAIIDGPLAGQRVDKRGPPAQRRSSGAHYTACSIAHEVIGRALGQVLASRSTAEPIHDLAVCDPAMGSGVFLIEVVSTLAASASSAGAGPSGDIERSIAERCVFGVDRDRIAVDLARLSLRLAFGADIARTARNLVHGDAVIGHTPIDGDRVPAHAIFEARDALTAPAIDWATAFPRVFAERGGFDAVVGNPPWVAYAGRAAQPLDERLHRYLTLSTPAFAGYRTLHGVFVHRAASVLRPGGRLGLVVPTSMADLDGYAPARRAHDSIAIPDSALPDYGAHAFDGVFQPAMAIVSTRRPSSIAPGDACWDLARSDLDETTQRMVERLGRAPTVPAAAFGERGFQTSRGDKEHFVRARRSDRDVALRIGSDVSPFRTGAPTYFVDPAELSVRWRSDDVWRAVDVYVRQTARFPMASLGDGLPFRNSILAGFGVEPFGRFALLAYLNALPVRFFHHARFRDARQGMPQIKIGHLRSVPMPCASGAFVAALEEKGRALGGRNAGTSAEEQHALDAMVAEAWGLDALEREKMRVWSADVGYIPRRRSP